MTDTDAAKTARNEKKPRKARKRLPKDPERMNNRRADWAETSINAFENETLTDREDALCDLLADLMHWCDRNATDFAHELSRAAWHYDEETDFTGHQLDRVTITERN